MAGDLEAFREIVLADRALQDDLLALSDRAAVIVRIVDEAERKGIALTNADVEVGLSHALQEWLTRWV